MSERPSVRITPARPGVAQIAFENGRGEFAVTIDNRRKEIGVTLSLVHLSELARAANAFVAGRAVQAEERPSDAAAAAWTAPILPTESDLEVVELAKWVIREVTQLDVRTISIIDTANPLVRHVAAHWRAHGKGDVHEYKRQVALVAWACRECDEHIFRNDVRGIRADGVRWGEDRSRSMGTVLRMRPQAGSGGATWEERVRVAERWAHSSTSTASPAPGPLLEQLTSALIAGGPAVERFANIMFHLMESAEERAYPDPDLDDPVDGQEDESAASPAPASTAPDLRQPSEGALDVAIADTIVTEAYRTNPPEKGKPGAVFAWMRELHWEHPGVDVDEMIAAYNRIRNTDVGQ